MIYNDNYSMDIKEPSMLKILEFEDICKHLLNTKSLIDADILLKYNFTPSEINWLFEEKGGFIKMQNEKVLRQTNKIINDLEIENIKLKTHINKLENEIKKMSEASRQSLDLEFIETKDSWIVHENRYRNNKHYKMTHKIPKQNVDVLLKIINLLNDDYKEYLTYREIVKNIILKYRLDVDVESFNGGRNRSKYLFPLYYYPMKILVHLNKIKYKGGKIYI